MTLYESFKDIMHDLYIMSIENYSVDFSFNDNDLWLEDGNFEIVWFNTDIRMIVVGLPDNKTSYRLTEDGTCYKYNCNTEKLRKISYSTFRKYFKQAVLSFGRSIQEEKIRLAREYPYLNC